jgi:hypothetical protein
MTSRRGIVTAFRTGFILAAWTEGGQQNGKPALAARYADIRYCKPFRDGRRWCQHVVACRQSGL